MRHTSDGVMIDHIALAILRQEDKVVLVQQQRPQSAHPYWVLPGGLVEAGEFVVDALIREVEEEAGVQVSAIAHLACCSQIDRPTAGAQTVAFIFEVGAWHGILKPQDPDALVLDVELVPESEAIDRLQHNRAWPGIQAPLLAYLRGTVPAGRLWFYRENSHGQQLITQCQRDWQTIDRLESGSHRTSRSSQPPFRALKIGRFLLPVFLFYLSCTQRATAELWRSPQEPFILTMIVILKIWC